MNQATPIPEKLYFKIGEVCEITGVKQHVLRYWESEFRMLSPQRANSRQRLYRRGDVENILRIKRLLKEEGFTISGAKKLLARERSGKGGGAEGEKSEAGKQGVPSPSVGAPPGGEEKVSVSRPLAPPPNHPSFFGGIKHIKQELLDLKRILER